MDGWQLPEEVRDFEGHLSPSWTPPGPGYPSHPGTWFTCAANHTHFILSVLSGYFMVHTKYSGLDTLGSPLQLIIPSVRMFNSIWFLLFSSPKQFLTDRKHRFLFESCLQNKRAQNIIRWRSQKFGQGEKRQQYGKIRKTREAAKNYVLSGFI